MHYARIAAALLGAGVLLGWEATARAGGLEIPDQGGQALGRGATFTAKADDPTAIYYNVAGLARQRGTRLLFSGNALFNSFKFTRAGTFPDDPNDPKTPWGGQRYPTVTNVGPPGFLPMVALTSDFHYFDRFTAGFALYAPSVSGSRTFPLGVQNAPSASRYDFVQSRSIVIYPTLAAAFRVTRWLDIGLGGVMVVGNLDQTNISYSDAGQCKNPEYEPCDVRSELRAKGTTYAGQIGVLARPLKELQFGLQFRTPYSLRALGSLTPTQPKILGKADAGLKTSDAQVDVEFPWVLRTGIRYVSMDGPVEAYDLELDVTYEAWGSTAGPRVFTPDLGLYKNVTTQVARNYGDTFSLRLGGAYNFDVFEGQLAARGGAFYDKAATDFAFTRVDTDTLHKVGATIGVGYKRGPIAANLAYAAIASIPRTVADGQVRPGNGAKEGKPVDGKDQLLPAYNNGQYKGFTHILGFSIEVTFDAFFGGDRKIRYGDPEYELVFPEDKKSEEKKPEDGEKTEDKSDDKKPEEKKPEEKKPEEKKPEEKKPDPKKPPGIDGCKWGEC